MRVDCISKIDFLAQFKKDCHSLYRKNMDILQQTACMIVDPIMVDTFASLFNCMTVTQSQNK